MFNLEARCLFHLPLPWPLLPLCSLMRAPRLVSAVPPSLQVANMRMPTAAGTAFPGTAGNGMGNGDVRPMTSVRGAGYSSGPAGGGGAKPVFDPFQQGGMATTRTHKVHAHLQQRRVCIVDRCKMSRKLI